MLREEKPWGVVATFKYLTNYHMAKGIRLISAPENLTCFGKRDFQEGRLSFSKTKETLLTIPSEG